VSLADGSPDARHSVWRDVRIVSLYEGQRRLRMTAVLSVLYVVLGWLYIWVGPELVAGEGIQDMIDAMPSVLRDMLGFESLSSLAGLLASEYYTLGWIVGLAGYVAYSAAGRVAGSVVDHRMDSLLAGPVARSSVLGGTYLALLVPILVLNVVVPVALYVGSVVVGSPLPIVDLAVVHLLSVPYLLLWTAVGLLVGVVLRGGQRAGRVALGVVFAGWLVESVLGSTDYAVTGAIFPNRYYDPPAVLVHGTYDVLGAGGLLLAAMVVYGLAQVAFGRRDL
jgi:ABC-2 type transport system permease protein